MRVKLILTSLRLVLRHFSPWRQAKGCHNMTVLDVGCGSQSPVAALTRRLNHWLVGLDIFKPAVRRARHNGAYGDAVLGDASCLPFQDNSFDVAVCTEVLEHLPKRKGIKLLHELERVSRWLIMVSCPIGKWDQRPRDGNPHQRHRYVWSLREMEQLEFDDIKGIGLKGLSGEKWMALVNSPFGPFLRILTLLGTLASYQWPRLGSNVFAWKEVSGATYRPLNSPRRLYRDEHKIA